MLFFLLLPSARSFSLQPVAPRPASSLRAISIPKPFLATFAAVSLSVAPAFIAPAGAASKDALDIRVNSLPEITKSVNGSPDLKTAVKIPGVPAVFSGGNVVVDVSLDTKRSKEVRKREEREKEREVI